MPASLQSYPLPTRSAGGGEDLLPRPRAAEQVAVEGGTVTVTLTAARAIDERGLAFFERSDLFGQPTVRERANEGRRLVVTLPIEQRRFLFGTDSNGATC